MSSSTSRRKRPVPTPNPSSQQVPRTTIALLDVEEEVFSEAPTTTDPVPEALITVDPTQEESSSSDSSSEEEEEPQDPEVLTDAPQEDMSAQPRPGSAQSVRPDEAGPST